MHADDTCLAEVSVNHVVGLGGLQTEQKHRDLQVFVIPLIILPFMGHRSYNAMALEPSLVATLLQSGNLW